MKTLLKIIGILGIAFVYGSVIKQIPYLNWMIFAVFSIILFFTYEKKHSIKK
jgi:hypothetical protein